MGLQKVFIKGKFAFAFFVVGYALYVFRGKVYVPGPFFLGGVPTLGKALLVVYTKLVNVLPMGTNLHKTYIIHRKTSC